MSTRKARSPRRHRPPRWEALLASLCVLWPVLLLAGEIFRYQDEQGNWHFTDDQPESYESSVVPDITTTLASPSDTEPAEDLAARLESVYSPVTPIAYATLAVVSIKAHLGEGSGFFCSDQGHILTNKHVVRPESTENLDGRKQSLEDRDQKLRTIEKSLQETRHRLPLMKRDLEGYDALIRNARDEDTRTWAKDARRRLSRRYRVQRAKISEMERNARTLKAELRSSEQEHGFAMIQRRFDIVLKDGTTLAASLVEVTDDQDLALLKLDGYRTPYLRLDSSQPLSQGIRVYAIGNPLGMQDAVTSGVVTQVTPEYLLTDAQILPGSSGGPLIRESGEVIGINVARKVAAGASKYTAGFGKVIPISLAIQAFPDVLTSIATEGYEAAPTAYPRWGETGNFEPHRIEGGSSNLNRGLGSGYDAISGTPPVRLVLPEEDDGLDREEPAERKTRSLDFPPEGSGVIPPGFSLPRE